MPAKKEFRIPGDKIAAVAPGRGSCIASDMILIDGHPVGYMYREPPVLEHDSGWRFFARLESQEYTDDPAHLAFYDVNTVANYDRSIVPWLDAAVGSAFERAADDQFVAVTFPDDPDSGWLGRRQELRALADEALFGRREPFLCYGHVTDLRVVVKVEYRWRDAQSSVAPDSRSL